MQFSVFALPKKIGCFSKEKHRCLNRQLLYLIKHCKLCQLFLYKFFGNYKEFFTLKRRRFLYTKTAAPTIIIL